MPRETASSRIFVPANPCWENISNAASRIVKVQLEYKCRFYRNKDALQWDCYSRQHLIGGRLASFCNRFMPVQVVMYLYWV